MGATIISDASYCGETGCAGWGAWMIVDGRRSLMCSGAIKTALASVNEAEIMALANALHVASREGYVADDTLVMLQSDSAWALSAIRHRIPAAVDHPHPNKGLRIVPHRRVSYTAAAERALALIVNIVRERRLVVQVRHVKGHTAGDGRHWVNRQCDHAAKKAMKLARSTMRQDTSGGGAP